MIEQLINSLLDNFYLFAFHYLCFLDAMLFFFSLYGIWSLPVCLSNPCNCSKCITKELRGFILLKTASDISLDLIALYRKSVMWKLSLPFVHMQNRMLQRSSYLNVFLQYDTIVHSEL